MPKARAFTTWTRRIAATAALLVGIPTILSIFITLEFADARGGITGGVGGGVLYIQIEVNSMDTRSRRPFEWWTTTHSAKLDTRPLRWPVRTARPYIDGTFRDILIIDLRLWVIALAAAGVALGVWLIGRRYRDPAKCPDCGYDIRGLTSGTCPECGSLVNGEGHQPAATSDR